MHGAGTKLNCHLSSCRYCNAGQEVLCIAMQREREREMINNTTKEICLLRVFSSQIDHMTQCDIHLTLAVPNSKHECNQFYHHHSRRLECLNEDKTGSIRRTSMGNWINMRQQVTQYVYIMHTHSLHTIGKHTYYIIIYYIFILLLRYS